MSNQNQNNMPGMGQPGMAQPMAQPMAQQQGGIPMNQQMAQLQYQNMLMQQQMMLNQQQVTFNHGGGFSLTMLLIPLTYFVVFEKAPSPHPSLSPSSILPLFL